MSDANHHDHGHSHGPSDDLQGYYTEQLLTVGACGALAGVSIMLYLSGKLDFILHPKFHLFVLLGGVTLLGLVILRGICLWISVGEPVAEPIHKHTADCDHHQHGPGCGHEHEHEHGHEHGVREVSQVHGVSETPATTSLPLSSPDHGHSHSHGHAHGGGGGGEDHHGHGWAPWRFVVLFLPVALFFLDLPNKAMIQAEDVSKGFKLDGTEGVKSRGNAPGVSFLMLEQAGLTQAGREFYLDKTVSLEGVFAGDNDAKFTLTRPTMNCCAADAITLKAVILVNYTEIKDEPNALRLEPGKLRGQWVTVTGTIRFLQPPGGGAYTTALIVTPTRDKAIHALVELMAKPPANQYAY